MQTAEGIYFGGKTRFAAAKVNENVSLNEVEGILSRKDKFVYLRFIFICPVLFWWQRYLTLKTLLIEIFYEVNSTAIL